MWFSETLSEPFTKYWCQGVSPYSQGLAPNPGKAFYKRVKSPQQVYWEALLKLNCMREKNLKLVFYGSGSQIVPIILLNDYWCDGWDLVVAAPASILEAPGIDLMGDLKNWSHSLVVKLFECSSNIALISFLSNDQGETHLPTHIWPQGYYSTKKLWNLKFRGEYILWNSPAHPYLGSRSNSCTGHSTLPFLMARGENNTNDVDDSDKRWQYFF